jgi:hypothetical protein
MKRFRFTLIAICLVLLYLGGNDLLLWFGNRSPRPVSISQLEISGAPQEWLTVEAGYLDLDRAISTSGSVELEALLVPLVVQPGQERIRVLVETRDPELLQLFAQYHFFMDTLPQKRAFRLEHAATFEGQRNITGMLVAGLIVRGNQQKLMKLAHQTDLDIADNVIFLSEGKEPGKWRGVFFAAVGLLGLFKVLTRRGERHPLAPDKP